ncbi:MAG: energy transducer TonB [Tannerella sp.]|jgi:TonB family protein|nr:energy transducer TonB [Tannerella sp.]
MKTDRDDIIALAGAIIIHALVAILLYFAVLRTIVPEEEGVLVNFGNIDAAAGLFEPQGYVSQNVEAAAPESSVPVRSKPEEMISQDTEETVSLAEQRKKAEEEKRREEAERREKERIETERRKREEEQRKREQAISEQVSGAFGTGSTQEGSQGSDVTGTGNQGNPFGNADTGENQGVGGMGEFSLAGRSLRGGSLPRPAYTIQEEGRIVVSIRVDRAGNVIFAEIGRGTTIDNKSMRDSAIEAARRAKFNSISGTNDQNGTITYRYNLK